jgi:hypothetical protein
MEYVIYFLFEHSYSLNKYNICLSNYEGGKVFRGCLFGWWGHEHAALQNSIFEKKKKKKKKIKKNRKPNERITF